MAESVVEDGKTETTISFAESYSLGAAGLSLIELPSEILQMMIADPTMTLKFMGREGEEAVLVTRDRTYAVRKGETSNTQLLIPSSMAALTHREHGFEDDGDAGRAVANVMEHYELLPIGPRLRMLPELLAKHPYEGPDYDAECAMDSGTPSRFTRGQLESMLQASSAEIDAELLALGALEVDGRLCLMADRYESNLMQHFFAAAVEQDWDLSALRPSECWASSSDLRSYPRCVLRTFFRKYKTAHAQEDKGNGMDGANMDVDEGLLSHSDACDGETQGMDIAAMSLFCADDLLNGSEKLLTVDEFKFAWQTMLPAKTDEGIFDLTRLRGRAVLEARGAQVVVKRFRVQNLSSDVKTRFKELFQQSSKWSKEDIVAYLQDLVSPSCTAEQLLLKHTRSVRQPGSDERTYTART